MGVPDRLLVEELTEASKASHVRFDANERAFVNSLRGRRGLTGDARRRATALFAREVDW